MNVFASDSSSDEWEMESSVKKQQSEPTPFTEENSSDDICLQFDDETKLYVHPVFLFLISPVFKAMFDHECVEKKTNKITLQGKKYKDFLEFLMCLHPAHQRRVDQSNVLRIVRLASEYQVRSIESKCQSVMVSCLSKSVENAKGRSPSVGVLEYLKTCLVVLDIAHELDYSDVKEKAIATVARFGFGLYTDQYMSYNSYDRKNWKELRKDCIEIFSELPDGCKSMVFFERLKYLDKKHETF